ncbi:sensor histidine kinase [Psychromarinibacter halotolerans]|uniref:histidine kinase n=1 Tax=Psychromarinibacter halotolerans TaxID=1775175 RepID=A0ABV7GN60_9RHOB|nr:ATP-binding protein [Psychromarinibacter halotolerans]MDF0596800.1 ATP-binding protein [Psychromarinibacter halotolerans]
MRLRSKITLAGVVSSVFVSVLFALMSAHFVRVQGNAEARRYLNARAALYAERIEDAFSRMQRDGHSLSGTPPVPGLIRAMRAPDGLDPLDGTSAELWRERLAQIFSAVLHNTPHFTQIRYIGMDDNWTELVRADRNGDDVQVVADADLQAKGNEPYLAPIRSGTDTGPYFSNVTLNREHGRDEGPPTIRYVVPVHDAGGSLFGALVINADYEKLLLTATPNLGSDFTVTAVTSALDHMTWTGDGVSDLRFHTYPGWTPPLHAALLPAADGRLVSTDSAAVVTVPVFEERPDRPFSLFIQTALPLSVLEAPAHRVFGLEIAAGAVVTALAALLSFVLGRQLTQPLHRLSDAIRAYRASGTPLPDLPAGRDEVGDLARAFRHMADDLIRESARSKAMVHGVADAIFSVDSKGRIEEANPVALALFGYSRDELIGSDLSLLVPTEIREAHRGFVREAVVPSRRKMGFNRTIHGVRKDGTRVPLEITISRAVYDGAAHFIGVVHDISERVESRRMQVLIEALSRSNEELDRFAYVASHDLKAPLRVIDNASRWLEEDLEEHMTDDTRESMTILRNRVVRMERLLDDLLAHSRIGRVPVTSQMISGTELEQALRGLIDLPPGFRFETGADLAGISVPRMPLETVLLNLVGNAIKHHDRDTGEVRLDVAETPEGYEFTVTDDGPGIAPEYHEKVFELFQTLRPRDAVEGSGMGLAMVRKQADVVGGRITVESDGTRGTCFRLFWPRVPLVGEMAA